MRGTTARPPRQDERYPATEVSKFNPLDLSKMKPMVALPGLDAEYEAPEGPGTVHVTSSVSVPEAVDRLIEVLA